MALAINCISGITPSEVPVSMLARRTVPKVKATAKMLPRMVRAMTLPPKREMPTWRWRAASICAH